ncbi:MAG: hypothetical protein C0467_26640 [Planctomycetaceae bacterium]|nr:hypothetical protein [Planctomycetaceae bacterium]
MYDAPGFYKGNESDFTSQTFKARTYLVHQKEILYTVQWSITVTKDKEGKWSAPVVSMDKSGPGKLDFPADVNADEWVWAYQDHARTKPIKVANPLK